MKKQKHYYYIFNGTDLLDKERNDYTKITFYGMIYDYDTGELIRPDVFFVDRAEYESEVAKLGTHKHAETVCILRYRPNTQNIERKVDSYEEQ